MKMEHEARARNVFELFLYQVKALVPGSFVAYQDGRGRRTFLGKIQFRNGVTVP